jgi:hypothetical protein
MNTHLFYVILFWLIAGNVASASDEGSWILSTSSRENYNGVTLANGRIGLVSSQFFSVTDIVLNGVYDKEDKEGVSRIVRGPVFTNLQLKLDGAPVSEKNITAWHQNLNMKEAYLETVVQTQKATIHYSIRALRNFPYMGMVVVELIPTASFELDVANSTIFPEELTETSATYKLYKDAEIELPVYTSQAKSRTGMQNLATCSAFLFDTDRPAIEALYGTAHHQSMGFKVRLKKGQRYRFALIGAVCSSKDFNDPKSEAERMAVFALQSDIDYFLTGHKEAWTRLWQSDIEIEGDEEAQRDIRLALYNLYASAGENTRLSIPPMGLTTVTGYNGHVFWDTELWMYPPLLMLNNRMARSCVDYRYDRLQKAMQKATLYGFKGCMYPWESDDTGEEATPTWCLTGTFEHHITADVGIAFWNYYCVTKDRNWLKSEGYPVLKQVADFWASRVVKNEDGSYSIKNVVGANEFAPNVNDNAFTNGSAKFALECATKAAAIVGEQAEPEWKEIAAKLRFHWMADGVMKENETYAGEIIKQADVNLLSYPLDILAEPESMKKNLDYYANKIHEDGPAMGNAILAILYAKSGDRDRAYEFFKKSYLPNKRPPFGVLSESAFSNNPYFCTGAGGLLQVLLSGFGGLKITDEGIIQERTILPTHWKSLTLKGIGPDKKTYVIR